ncbi:class I SAM-dependent methyltransferase [candidate division KSB1 bacterium]|nr:class I SAM-dependent methyltransferase [candidate division KSB1 bacterium]
MNDTKNRVCPVERAGGLDNRFRRWLQNPFRILKPFIEEGMTVLDVGCGPGFFTIDMAKLVGASGRVIAADLQTGMLDKVRKKFHGTMLESRIRLHQCEADIIGIIERVDFILLFYMVHEVPSKQSLFQEITSILKPGGKILIVEPSFHVSQSDFDEMLLTARNAGLSDNKGPHLLFSRTVVLTH